MSVRSSWKTALMPLLIISLLVSCNLERDGPNTDGAKIREIEAIWNTMPYYAGMEEVDNSRSSTGTKAHMSKGFRCAAKFDEVREFYVKTLSDAGWQLVEDRRMYDWWRDFGGHYLAFRKSEYKLSIQYAGEKADYGWNYGIGVYWNDL